MKRLQKKLLIWLTVALFGAGVLQFNRSWAVDSAVSTQKSKVRYRKSKTMDFENLLIKGEKKRGEMLVVTGSARQGADGLLKLREDFLDRTANDIGEELK